MLLGLALVVLGSSAHAVWNVLAKRSGASGTAFVWQYSALSTPLLVVALLAHAEAGGGLVLSAWWAALVSAGLHTTYALVLQASYARAELGVVYPVARAGAPVLVGLASIPLLQVHATLATWLGIALICVGVPLLVGSDPGAKRLAVTGLVAGLATATTIAAYTLWDAYAVTRLDVDVLSYLVVGSCAQLVVLTLAVGHQRAQLAAFTRTQWRRALPIAVLVPVSYGLVLLALHHVDVTVVAAARSISILAAAVLGWWWLDERPTVHRVAGAVLLTVGAAATALGS